MGAELRLITVCEPLPAYVAYADVAFPGSKRMLAEERQAFYNKLQEEAKARAAESGMVAGGVIVAQAAGHTSRAEVAPARRSAASAAGSSRGRPAFTQGQRNRSAGSHERV